MMVVLGMSSTPSRFSDRPVCIVRTFQLAIRRAGDLLSFLLVAGPSLCLLFGFCPILGHPPEAERQGGSTTNWPGAAQLKAGVRGPIGHEGPSHRRPWVRGAVPDAS